METLLVSIPTHSAGPTVTGVGVASTGVVVVVVVVLSLLIVVTTWQLPPVASVPIVDPSGVVVLLSVASVLDVGPSEEPPGVIIPPGTSGAFRELEGCSSILL